MPYTKTHDRKLMFTCRAGVLLAAAVIMSACDPAPTSSSSTGLFDDFSADMIDHTKWANTETVRRVENGKLVSAVTRFGSNDGDTMNFVAAREITGFKADVTVTDVESVGAELRAWLVGAFYNDGSTGSGMAGDVLGGVEISHIDGQLRGTSWVLKCITDSCGAFNVIHFGRSFGRVLLNETHTLSIDFDGKKFTFGFDDRTLEVDPTSHAPVAGPPHSAFKGIGTHVDEINGPDQGGLIAATFDNVVVIRDQESLVYKPDEVQVPLDDFNADMIDHTKWANTETVRRVENGKLVSAVTRFGSNDGDTLNFADARKISGFKADVTVTEVENVNAKLNARLVGAFYNEGTSSGPGIAGDVLAGIQIHHVGKNMWGQSFVVVCITDACNRPGEYRLIRANRISGQVALNETHTLSIDFDGKKFTFGFDDRTLEVDPRIPVVGPPHSAFKGIGTRIGGIDGPDEGGFIAATFDNVEVTFAPLIVGSASGPSVKSFDSPIGEWKDKYQTMQGSWEWSSTTIIDEKTATYTNPDGRVFFYATDNHDWEGHWVEDGTDECSEEKHGSKNWGVIIFRFNDAYNKYEGTWDSCGIGQKFPFNGFRM